MYNINNATLGCYKYGTEFVGFNDKCPNQIVQIFDSIIPQKIKQVSAINWSLQF